MSRPLRIYVSYDPDGEGTAEQARRLVDRLAAEGFDVKSRDNVLLPGDNIQSSLRKAINSVDIFLAVPTIEEKIVFDEAKDETYGALHLQFDTSTVPYALEEKQYWSSTLSYIIPLIPSRGKPLDSNYGGINAYQPAYVDTRSPSLPGVEKLVDYLRQIATRLDLDVPEQLDKSLPPSSFQKIRENWQVTKFSVENIRCFKYLILEPRDTDRDLLLKLVTFLGDNAVGKSTLIRSIALGLCNESDAAALLRAAPGNFIREGCSEGKIHIELRREGELEEKYSIETKISLDSSHGEIVRKETTPAHFPWPEVFICGYGTSRTNTAQASHESYSAINAVRSLFDERTTLQNPELALLRREPALRELIETKLRHILLLDDWEQTFDFSRTGLCLNGPWGQQPIGFLSDGYRSTIQWVLDFLSWAIYADRFPNPNGKVGGILLIDELEQHLHPRWQRYIIQRLQNQFPNTQIFATTHSPLVASGVADLEDGLLVKLKPQPDGSVEPRIIPNEAIRGKRADQVLASEAFDLITTRSPGSMSARDLYAELLGKRERTPAEETELASLRKELEEKYTIGDRFAAQLVEQVTSIILDLHLDTPPELIEIEAKRHVKALFDAEGTGEED